MVMKFGKLSHYLCLEDYIIKVYTTFFEDVHNHYSVAGVSYLGDAYELRSILSFKRLKRLKT